MDFKTENGFEWKLFLSELKNLKAQQQLEKLDPIEEVSEREGKELMKNELDEIELLIEKLALTKNRKEKRRLLAIYNQRQAKIWGSGQQKSFGTLSVYQNAEFDNPLDMDKIWSP